MHIVLNNVKVLCVFSVWGFLTNLYLAFIMVYSEKLIPESTFVRIVLLIPLIFLTVVVIVGNYVMHFLSGRYFLHSVNNHFINITAFALIIILAVIYSRNPDIYILRIVYCPSIFLRFLSGEGYLSLGLSITVFLSIALQFSGMVRGLKIHLKKLDRPHE